MEYETGSRLSIREENHARLSGGRFLTKSLSDKVAIVAMYQVRTVRCKDLQALVACLPVNDDIFRHDWLMSQQAAGSLDYVAAWALEKPIGRGVILWDGYTIPELTAEFPGTPVIRSVEVLEEHRHLGVGSKIVAELERRALRRGFTHVSLGVRPDNTRAERLWRRLGYEDWGKGSVSTISKYEGSHGEEIVRNESFLPMRKRLVEGN